MLLHRCCQWLKVTVSGLWTLKTPESRSSPLCWLVPGLAPRRKSRSSMISSCSRLWQLPGGDQSNSESSIHLNAEEVKMNHRSHSQCMQPVCVLMLITYHASMWHYLHCSSWTSPPSWARNMAAQQEELAFVLSAVIEVPIQYKTKKYQCEGQHPWNHCHQCPYDCTLISIGSYCICLFWRFFFRT